MRIVAIAIVIVTSTSCATLRTNGTTQRITVTSTPSDAEVFLDGQPVGRTPTQVVVSRRSRDPVIRVTKDGFRPRWKRLQRSTSWWLLESIGAGVAGLFGSLLLTADQDSFSPEQHIARLGRGGRTGGRGLPVKRGIQVPVAGRPHSLADRPQPVAAGTETRATARGAAVTLPGAGRVLGSPGGGQR